MKLIDAGLEFDQERGKWVCEYPLAESETVLSDNRSQAVSLYERQERRLIKQGEKKMYDDQFLDAVSRGVYRELTEDEDKAW